VAAYNAERWLAETLSSVEAQTYPSVEAVVVDDGSADGTLAVARRFEGPGVRVLTQPNGGACAARNRAVAAARGAYVQFLDADDVLGPTAIEALVGALRQRPGAIAACPWYRLDREGAEWVRRPPSCEPRRPGQDALAAWLIGWYHPPCSVLWSREAFAAAGPWEESLALNQDGHLMMQAFARGVPLVLTDHGEAFYRRLETAGAASVSGRRLSDEGLRARLWVLDQLAATLRDRGRLDAYRRPLDEALERVGREAGDRHPGVVDEAVALARRWTRYPWLRTERRVRRRARSALQAAGLRLGADGLARGRAGGG
jgi:glycosyltransferase involved in cell wall biosynthesis